MPSVGMRRTTRVFGARVLRSGRRLWSGPGEGKQTRAAAAASAADREEWIELLDNSEDSSSGGSDDEIQRKKKGWRHDVGMKQEFTVVDTDENKAEPQSVKIMGTDSIDHNSGVDRMWGSVYQRKRKRIDSKCFDFDGSSEKTSALEDRKYGKQFVRKQKRSKNIKESCPCPVSRSFGWQGSVKSRVFAAVIESSSRSSTSSLFACFLSLVLRYMRRTKLKLLQLSAFVFSEPFAHVFSAHGIHFLRDSPSIKSFGICKIFGARCSMPLFAVDFSAVPFCFMYLHSALLLRSACLPFVVETYSNVEEDRMTEVVEHLPCITSQRDSPGNETVTVESDNSGKRNALHPAVGASKTAGRALQFRNGVNSRSIQKRRSALRSRREKVPSVSRGRKANGALVSNLFSSRQVGISLVPVVSDRELRSSVRKISSSNIKELKSSLVGLTQDIDSTCCFANILVIESDKCYRIKGAIVKLEISSSKQWFLAVKKDGITRYSLTAQKVMRPCSSNRVTHDIIWTENNNWKLEFPYRRDWLVFKELYRECSNRNVQAPTANIIPANIIPVPGIHEVSGYADSDSVPYRQPNLYISVKDDELSRALAKGTANYDMDSEDEEWLRKTNNESSARNEHWEHVSNECFELIIDAFEKYFYCTPDNYSNEKSAVNVCLYLERKEVVEAVYSYWMEKRKQKGSALVKVFQCYQPRRGLLLPKPILRKKRSFKQQASHSGRVEQRTSLQAMATERNTLEEQNALLKVQEARTAVSRSEGLAVTKRQRAQLLMENADLATYKAAIALRIAEAARVAESADAAASFFLH